MKDVKFSIRATDIRSLNYQNNFSGKPGEQMKMDVKTNVAVKLNSEVPTMALVCVKFEAKDVNGIMSLDLETMTQVSVSTFVDNLDEVIKKNYMTTIMLAVNEKIRMAATNLGLNIAVPPMVFEYRDGNDGDNIVNFDENRRK